MRVRSPHTKPKSPKRRAALCVSLLALASSRPAFGSEVAAAEALFLEGKELILRGEVAPACDKFAESQRLEPSSGTLLNLAACHERLGLVATAWAEYRGAEHLARQQGKTVRVDEARRKSDDLAPRLSFLTIRVEGPVPGLEVKRDGTRLESGALGSPIPTDPGLHRVTASAPDHAPFEAEVTLGDGGDRKEVVVPALSPSPQTPGQPTRPVLPPVAPPEPRRDPTLGLAVAGAGLGVVALSGVFFVLSLSADGKARTECPRGYGCSDEALSYESRRDTFATIATVGGIVGAVGVGVGAFLVFRPAPGAASGRATAPRTAIVPRAGFGSGTLSLEGVF